MQSAKRARLTKAGWRLGTPAEFLKLSPDEAAYVEIKLALGDRLRATHLKERLTQTELAERLGSSQSRVAKMEAADRTVSIDLLLRSLLQLGVSPRQIAKVIG